MTDARASAIEQLENTILLIKQNGEDWLDERDIPILKEAIKAMQTETTWIVGKDNAQVAVRNMPVDKFQKICAIIGGETDPIEIEAAKLQKAHDEGFESCRRAAIDALRNAENQAFNAYYKGLVHAHKIIADLPPVQPKGGWWIEKYHERFKYYCSSCNSGSDLKTKFCPNCGEKKVEQQESEDKE